MSATVTATFDGKVFLPDEPLHLEPNTKVRITIEKTQPAPPDARSFLQTAQSLRLDGPPDWSARFEEYLYGDERD